MSCVRRGRRCPIIVKQQQEEEGLNIRAVMRLLLPLWGNGRIEMPAPLFSTRRRKPRARPSLAGIAGNRRYHYPGSKAMVLGAASLSRPSERQNRRRPVTQRDIEAVAAQKTPSWFRKLSPAPETLMGEWAGRSARSAISRVSGEGAIRAHGRAAISMR
jgi:hypothetical protein